MANCPHGFPEDQCLICRTLGTGQAPRATKAAERSGGTLLAEPVMRHPARAGNGATPARRRRGIGARAITGLVVIVVAGLMVWAFAGIFVLAFHIFEYAALALVAGWVGYKLGHAKGRHEHRAT